MTTYSLTVPNKNGSYDGDMVIKQFTTLNISSGNVLTTDQPCRGMFLYVQGDCTINGTLSMTARGAAANPTVSGASDSSVVNSSGLQYGFFASGSADSLTVDSSLFNGCGTTTKTAIANAISGAGINYKVATISRSGANGGPKSTSVSSDGSGSNISIGKGVNASIGQTGGGGGGGQGYGVSYAKGGAGSLGTCFSGGSGGGGGGSGGGGTFSIKAGYDAVAYGAGGRGGADDESSGTRPPGGGGAGNPGGIRGTPGNASYGTPGDNGTGGTIILVVGGNLTIGASGKIEADGSKGGWANGTSSEVAIDANGYQVSNSGSENAGGGGGSGGGAIIIIVKGTITVAGSTVAPGTFTGTAYSNKITVKGGRGGGGGGVSTGTWNVVNNTYQGAFGGDGSIQVYQCM